MKAEVFDVPWMAMDLPFSCEIHTFAERPSIASDAKKVLVICTEPRAGMVSNDWVFDNYKKFDLIITYDRALQHLPNVEIQDFGGAFCDERPFCKSFSYSFLFSTGTGVPHYHGYAIRRFIADNFGAPNIPGELFLSSRRLEIKSEEIDIIRARSSERNYNVKVVGSSKLPLFESMFHIAIENHNDDYFFTEKLIDCFRTFTIPIYWGTKKISEKFDMNGVIHLEKGDDFQRIISSLTIEDYWGRLESINSNYISAGKYVDVVGNIRSTIVDKFTKSTPVNDGKFQVVQ